jgi:hypothetical protein
VNELSDSFEPTTKVVTDEALVTSSHSPAEEPTVESVSDLVSSHSAAEERRNDLHATEPAVTVVVDEALIGSSHPLAEEPTVESVSDLVSSRSAAEEERTNDLDLPELAPKDHSERAIDSLSPTSVPGQGITRAVIRTSAKNSRETKRSPNRLVPLLTPRQWRNGRPDCGLRQFPFFRRARPWGYRPTNGRLIAFRTVPRC